MPPAAGTKDNTENASNRLASKLTSRTDLPTICGRIDTIRCSYATIPKHCKGVVKNRYHNGHPDLVPANCYDNDVCQHGTMGIEVKASRYLKAWQGHNAEDIWLMVFVFDSNRPADAGKGVQAKPFRFRMVVGAELKKSDWLFAGRSETSRRTITASVTHSGLEKMLGNWIYKDEELCQAQASAIERILEEG
jgi:hypothetical protein